MKRVIAAILLTVLMAGIASAGVKYATRKWVKKYVAQ